MLACVGEAKVSVAGEVRQQVIDLVHHSRSRFVHNFAELMHRIRDVRTSRSGGVHEATEALLNCFQKLRVLDVGARQRVVDADEERVRVR